MKSNPNHAPNKNPANDNGGRAVAPTPAGGALVSLAALKTALDGVDTSGRSGKPIMFFKSRESGGTWMIGQKRDIPEEDSLWAANPATFAWGNISFNAANKVAGERMVPIIQSRPDITTLPDTGFPWQEQWAVDMKCINGIDAGVEVVFKINTVGGDQVIKGLIETIRNRIDGDQHGGKVVPILKLGRDSYRHPQHGPVGIPVLEVVDWISFEGPVPAPKPESPSPPAEQSRRRRVG
jgi:hypothetical protein